MDPIPKERNKARMSEKELITKIRRLLASFRRRKEKPLRITVWTHIYGLIREYTNLCVSDHYMSHEPEGMNIYSFVPLCFCKEKYYDASKCLHFTLVMCEKAEEAYCIPYDTLILRTHRKMKCPDGKYAKTNRKI